MCRCFCLQSCTSRPTFCVALTMAQFSVVGSRAPVTYTAHYSVNCDAVTGKSDPEPDCIQAPSGAVKRPVLYTALTSGQARQLQIGQFHRSQTAHASQRCINKVLIKAFSKQSKKEWKTFTLRNIDTTVVCTVSHLKDVIKTQLQGDVHGHFDVGYLQGSNHVTFRSACDIKEVWTDALKGSSVVLWCDGLRTEQTNPLASRKRKNAIVSSDESSEDEQGRANKKRKRNTAVKSREEKVEEVVNSLKEKHNKLYTPMQYRI